MNELTTVAVQVFQVVLQLSLHASVVLFLILAVRYALGNKLSARQRYIMWGIVIARMLIPWNYEVPVPAELLYADDTGNAATPQAFAQTAIAPATPGSEIPIQSSGNTPARVNTVSPSLKYPNPSTPAPNIDSIPVDVGTILAGIWLLGALAVPSVILFNHVRFTRRLLRSSAAPPSWVQYTLDDVRSEFGYAARPRILLTPIVHSPTLLGAIRSKILLPSDLVKDTPPKEMRLFLLHELIHLRTGDIWFGWLWCFALSVHWFNPLMWWSGMRIRKDRELACDEAVVGRIGSDGTGDYAQALLRAVSLISGNGQRRYRFGLAAIAESQSEIARRIESVLTPVVRSGGIRYASAVAQIFVLCASFVLVAPIHRTVEAQDEPASSDVPANASAFIQLVDAEMKRIVERHDRGDAYRDKSDCSRVYAEFKEQNPSLADDQLESLIRDLSGYAEAHRDNEIYGWRIWHLKSLVAQDKKEQVLSDGVPISHTYLREAIALYPHTKYSVPSKHSKFQHLVNEMAMLIWDTEGLTAAEKFLVDTWKDDRRFQYFFDHPWRQRMESEGIPLERLENLQARLADRPPLKKVEFLLTPNGLQFEGVILTRFEDIKNALSKFEKTYEHYIAMGISTEEISLKQYREAQDNLMQLQSELDFDHFSDIGLQASATNAKETLVKKTSAVASTNDGTYARAFIDRHDGPYFLDRIAEPESGYHRFAALWAVQFKASTADEVERKEIVNAALKYAEDASKPFNGRYQCCYLASSFEIHPTIERLAAILQHDPLAPLRGVAASALGHFESTDAKDALKKALKTEDDKSVRSWIERAVNGEIPRPIVWQPGVTP